MALKNMVFARVCPWSGFTSSGNPASRITFISHQDKELMQPIQRWSPKLLNIFGIYGESAGARTQDQRLKRAMLYQLSYALRPHYQVSTVDSAN
jgi:hypothetical protein